MTQLILSVIELNIDYVTLLLLIEFQGPLLLFHSKSQWQFLSFVRVEAGIRSLPYHVARGDRHHMRFLLL